MESFFTSRSILFDDKIDKILFPIVEKYKELFSTKGFELTYQFCHYGDYSDTSYSSEIGISILKICDGKIIDFIDHIDAFVILRNKENVDPEAFPQEIERELKLIWDKV